MERTRLAEVTFGEWLKRRRKGLGLTQRQLAARIYCSSVMLKKIEAEERRPSAQIVERLAETFNIPKNEKAALLRFARGDWKAAPGETEEDFPWSTSIRSPRTNLPAPVTSLIGREKEIAAVREYLEKADIRLVTLIGPPGIGKTRLSIESARAALPDFPDGVFFVPLAPLDDPSLIALTIIQALGYVEKGNFSSTKQLIEGIGEKQMLIVLDNCEHLIEEIASLASELLSACSRLKILVTSRESLRVPGEWLYPLPALEHPTENSPVDLSVSLQFPALTLFAERAHAVNPVFALDADNIKTVSTICAQLDGLPLAIELIAARIRLISPETLLERLNDQFILSADGVRAVPVRRPRRSSSTSPPTRTTA
jgi:transcriptional regulator with XRE-family HTH domain